MQQIIKRYFWIALLAVGLQATWAFSILGPLPPDPGGEPWQVAAIGYNQPYEFYGLPGDPSSLGDIGGPHAIGEEYRRNAPILYYSYDQSFTEGGFFGFTGQESIDEAFVIMSAITNVDKYSPGLDEFPLTAQHSNPKAQAMFLTDIKSVTLHLLVEQMGLADPARFSWTLHDRFVPPGCPLTTTYLVVQRNIDGTSIPSLATPAYSPYVNGSLLTYYISEACPPGGAATVVYMTDPAGVNDPNGLDNIPVAANIFEDFLSSDTATLWKLPVIYGLNIGGYYAGLTRDDVAGLRYLETTNNANIEQIPASSLLLTITTNLDIQTLFPANGTNFISGTNGGFYTFDGTFGYGDYGWLLATSMTNSPAALQALYPGLVIASSSNYFTLATNWVYTQYFTNAAGPGSPYPPPLTLVTVSNKVVFPLEKYVTTFANVFPNKIHATTSAKLQTTVVQPLIGAPYPQPIVTNVTVKNVTLNTPSGDFFVLPLFQTNFCPLDFLYPILTNVQTYTNFLTGALTNVVTTTNTSSFVSTLFETFSFTNYIWVTHPVTCASVPNAVRKFRGIGGVKFIRNDDINPTTGLYNHPVTNYYTMVAQNPTNLLWETQHLVRIVVRPDILLRAADLATGPAGVDIVGTVLRTIHFNSTQIVAGLHGPGTIDTQSLITYDRVGSVFENGPFLDADSFINPTEVNETTQVPSLQWASYNGTTNDPVLYPNGTSLQNLEDQAVVQLFHTPSGPLIGGVGLPYTAQFNAVGGPYVPQFTWTATGVPNEPGSGLPPGLSLSGTGQLSGTPTTAGIYDFILKLTDLQGHTAQWTLSITIN